MSNEFYRQEAIGEFLKRQREAVRESLAEASGAVEITPDALHKIETGRSLPSEDILLLLMRHFNVDEDRAERMLDMAGYGENEAFTALAEAEALVRQICVMLPLDTRVLHVEDSRVRATPDGVVADFLQQSANGQQVSVARVSLSKRQARQLIDNLQQALQPSAPKAIAATARASKQSQQRANHSKTNSKTSPKTKGQS